MIIYPVRWADTVQGKPTLYVSEEVFTTIQGKEVLVCQGYEGKTVGEIIAQAVGNALVKRMRHDLAQHMCVRNQW